MYMNAFWKAPLADTLANSSSIARGPAPTLDAAQWLTRYAEEAPTSSNQGSAAVAFQRWFHFKEAFSPKFVADTLASLPYKATSCLDPFGGSGTTALTSRMLGLSSTTVEVNPFLADLIEAKLTPVSPAAFRADYERTLAALRLEDADRRLADGMPTTMTEPGVNGRFVFSAEVFATARALVRASTALRTDHARLFRVLLGSVLVQNSNVTINGKGRRYRRGWAARERTSDDLIESLDAAVDRAVEDITSYAGLPQGRHAVLRGDARAMLGKVETADVAILSPPYPNSFDYTDVYNLELWMLDYLRSGAHNRALRRETLRSHVQIKWDLDERICTSGLLTDTVAALTRHRADLWNRNIPEMVGHYFDDLYRVFAQLARILPTGHHAVVAIGDSQYAGVLIDVAAILEQSLPGVGLRLTEKGTIRSMRSSSQHGGTFSLSEHCLVFERV